MHLYLIRHGQSVENTTAWDGKNTNSPLTDLGRAQASALGTWLAQHGPTFDKIYASPMQRTRQTAGILAQALGWSAVHYDDRLREIGNARPDGSPFPDDSLPRYILGIWGTLHPYKPVTVGGENWMHFRARVGGFIEALVESMPAEHSAFRVAVICHGGVIEGVFEHIFQKGPWSAVIVHSHNTGITHLEYIPMGGYPDWRLSYHNQTRHLALDQLS
jgi:broad specificity phosphatase PhoE